jgi:hypothetical protein
LLFFGSQGFMKVFFLDFLIGSFPFCWCHVLILALVKIQQVNDWNRPRSSSC